MSADDIIKIINQLPEYIKLLYPGYITIYLYYFFRAITVRENKTVIFKALILSYIYNIIIDDLCDVFFIQGNLNYEVAYNLLLILVSIIVSYVSYRIVKSKYTIDILQWFKVYTTFSTNEIEELQNQSKNGTWMVVFLRDSKIVYEGYLINKEMEPDKRQYITLSNYRKYIIDNSGRPVEPYIEDHSDNENEKALIFYELVTNCEIRDTQIKETQVDNTAVDNTKIKESA